MKTLKMKYDELLEKCATSNNPIAKERAEYFSDYKAGGRKYGIALMQMALAMTEAGILEYNDR